MPGLSGTLEWQQLQLGSRMMHDAPTAIALALSAWRPCVQDDEMFLEEINLMRRLSHPHIIRYLGCGMIEEGGAAHISIVRCCLMVALPQD